jgi:holin-like protein
MKMIRQFAIVTLICFLGEVITKVFNLTIPGNVIGMVLLLILLCTGVVKLEFVEEISNFLLDHLPFFFLPAGVGLIASIGIIKSSWQYIILIIFISTVVGMAVTAITVQLLKRS